MVTFMASIAIASFVSINDIPNILSRVIYAAVWLIVMCLIIWTLFIGYETMNNSFWYTMFVNGWQSFITSTRQWEMCLGRRAKGDHEAQWHMRVKNGPVCIVIFGLDLN